MLLLDNFEQIAAAAPLLGELLEAAPRLKLLVTSRVVLRIYGEHKFEVPPLSLPDTTVVTSLPPLEVLSRYDAIALFIQRARAVKANFVLNTDNARAYSRNLHPFGRSAIWQSNWPRPGYVF